FLTRQPPLFFFQAEDGIRDRNVTGVQKCALPIYLTSNTSGLSRVRTIFDGCNQCLSTTVDGPLSQALERERSRRNQGSKTKVQRDRKSTRLNSSHVSISYAVFCLKKKKKNKKKNK